MKGKEKRKFPVILMILPLVGLLLAGGILLFWKEFRITSVIVEGNTHYTDDEIVRMVIKGKADQNSLFLSMKYKNKEIRGIPFIETMDVKFLSRRKVRITVYEKSLAGYVDYLDRYLYFDKDGIVVESSQEKIIGVPQVCGLQFSSVRLYEKLPVGNDVVFKDILSMTQLLAKYKLAAERIYFADGNEMTLYFGNVRVLFGTSAYIDQKVSRLSQILPKLEGRSGVLDMRDYRESSDHVTFMQDQE